ncbi:MAG TPA: hypothetical protein VHJ99_00120 [Candidatus Dormibacteraeota bacterium]|nr:hypothetical protein [Candidatus Dormibacteraeota bacterium]
MGRRDVLHVMERLREHTNIFYSTHILDDVQRVSDSVAILNRGTWSPRPRSTSSSKDQAAPRVRKRLAELTWVVLGVSTDIEAVPVGQLRRLRHGGGADGQRGLWG